MTAEPNNTNHTREQWIWRKGIYFIIGGALAIAAIIGWVTIEQVESWLEITERALPTLGSVALLFAGYKTGPGSDERVTHVDVEEAAARASSTAVNSKVFEYMDQVSVRLEQLSERLAGGTSSPLEGEQPATTTGPGAYPRGE